MVLLDSIYNCWNSKVLSDVSSGNEEAEAFITDIVRLHDLLSRRGENLEPCAAVNALFTELVELCLRILPEETTIAVGCPTAKIGSQTDHSD